MAPALDLCSPEPGDRARAARDWTRADALRDELAALGAVVEDTAKGSRIKRKT